jgi:hypothetical protein
MNIKKKKKYVETIIIPIPVVVVVLFTLLVTRFNPIVNKSFKLLEKKRNSNNLILKKIFFNFFRSNVYYTLMYIYIYIGNKEIICETKRLNYLKI